MIIALFFFCLFVLFLFIDFFKKKMFYAQNRFINIGRKMIFEGIYTLHITLENVISFQGDSEH